MKDYQSKSGNGHWHRFALAACSGLMLSLSFPGYNFSLLAWVALVPLLWALRGANTKDATLTGLVTGLFFFGPTLSWVQNTMVDFGHMASPLALAVNLLMVFVLSLYFGLFGAIFALTDRRFSTTTALTMAPAIWIALEFFRGSGALFLSFPWARICDSQYKFPLLIQIADITGAEGVSFVIIAINCGVTSILLRMAGTCPRPPRTLALLPLMLLIVCLIYGAMALNNQPSPTKTVSVALIQGNIDQSRKWQPAYQQEQLDIYFSRTMNAADDGARLIIWPETAVPFFFGQEPHNDALLDNLGNALNVSLIFGAPAYEWQGKKRVAYNRAWSLTPGKAGRAMHYDKVRLVPFGEYVPMKSVLFFVNKLTDAIGGMESGGAVTLIDGGGFPVGIQICFEIIFPEYSREAALNGATALVNITNDSWFGDSPASEQSLAMAVFRAVENRLPVARAAQSGVSAFVDSTGRITGRTRLFVETTLMGQISPRSGSRSVYTLVGPLLSWLSAFITVILIAVSLRRNGSCKREKR